MCDRFTSTVLVRGNAVRYPPPLLHMAFQRFCFLFHDDGIDFIQKVSNIASQVAITTHHSTASSHLNTASTSCPRKSQSGSEPNQTLPSISSFFQTCQQFITARIDLQLPWFLLSYTRHPFTEFLFIPRRRHYSCFSLSSLSTTKKCFSRRSSPNPIPPRIHLSRISIL